MSNPLNGVAFLDGFADSDRNRAMDFKRNEHMERLAALRDSQPDAYDRISPTIRMGLGYYENDKKNAIAHGVDVNKGNN